MKKIVVMILLLIVTVSSVSISVSADDNMIGSKFSKKYFNYYSDSHDKEDKLLLGVFLENDEVISSFSIDNQSDTVKYIREKRAEYVTNRTQYLDEKLNKDNLKFPETVDIIFESDILPFVVVNANFKEAKEISKLRNVSYIEIYQDTVEVKDYAYNHYSTDDYDYGYLDESSLSIYYKETTKINQVRQNYSVDGNEIWIGFLESGVIDHSHPELSSKSVIKSTTGNVTPHATLTSIIASGTSNGVAPGAKLISKELTLESDGSITPSNLFSDMESLVIMGADIINISAGVSINGEYDDLSRYVDALINETKVVVVISAGNGSHFNYLKFAYNANKYVNALGLAQNAITVGATTANGEKIASYSAFETTYDSLPYATKSVKPTIVAPGGDSYSQTSINGTLVTVFSVSAPLYIPNSPYKIADSDPDYDEQMEDKVAQINHVGTSFSAPIVSGAVALLFEYKPALMLEPEKVIAILSASADYYWFDINDGIDKLLNIDEENYNSSTGNIDITTHNGYSYDPQKGLNEYSGAGLLNLSEAFKIAQNGDYFYFSTCTSSPSTVFSKQLVFEAGDHVQFSLVSLRNIEGGSNGVDDYSFDDYDLLLYKGSTLIMETESSTSNVEKFYIDIPTNGVYTIVVKLRSKGSAPGNPTTYRFTEISVAIDSTKGYSFYIPSC